LGEGTSFLLSNLIYTFNLFHAMGGSQMVIGTRDGLLGIMDGGIEGLRHL